MYFRLILSLLKTLQGECKIQFQRDMECILDCIYLLLETLLEECKVQFQRDLECFLGWNCLLLKTLLGECKIQIHRGMKCIYRLYLSLIGKTLLGECKIQFHRDMECILDCIYLLLGGSAGEIVKYSSTGIWNVFLTVSISCWKKLHWGKCKIQFPGLRNVF